MLLEANTIVIHFLFVLDAPSELLQEDSAQPGTSQVNNDNQ